MFINFSNHPSTKWNNTQCAAAMELGNNRIVDIPFPVIDPHMSTQQITELANIYIDLIMTHNPTSVLCQGEMVFSFMIINQLIKQAIPVYAACSDRITQDHIDSKGHTVKTSLFEFVQFRNYVL